MNEAEWLTTDNPERMLDCFRTLHAAGGFARPPLFKASPRKMRLVACAIERQFRSLRPQLKNSDCRHIDAAERMADDPSYIWDGDRYSIHAENAYHAAAETLRLHDGELDRAAMPSLLRDIVGNPFRPVTLFTEENVEVDHFRTGAAEKNPFARAAMKAGAIFKKVRKPVPWLTSTVLAIAQRAYGETCGCVGSWTDIDIANEQRNGPCTACSGSGRTPFDASVLPVLADCLEESGCVDADMLQHLRGFERCVIHRHKFADGTVLKQRDDVMRLKDCDRCSGTGWRPLPTACVRGCWVVDLLLGKE